MRVTTPQRYTRMSVSWS